MPYYPPSSGGNTDAITSQSVQPGVQQIVASNASFSSGTVSISGTGEGITVNTQGSMIRLSGGQTGVKSLVASDATFTAGQVSVTGLGGATVNTAASKIQVSVPNAQTLGATEFYPAINKNTATNDGLGFATASPMFFRAPIPGHISVDSVRIGLNITSSSSNSSGSVRFDVGLYTRNGSSLSSLATSSYTTSWTSNSTTNVDWLGYSGIRAYNIPFATSLTPGDYWLGLQARGRSAWSGLLVGIPNVPTPGAIAGNSLTTGVANALPFGAGAAASSISNNAFIAATDLVPSLAGWPWMYLFNASNS